MSRMATLTLGFQGLGALRMAITSTTSSARFIHSAEWFVRCSTAGPPRCWFADVGKTTLMGPVGLAAMFIGGGPPRIVYRVSSLALRSVRQVEGYSIFWFRGGGKTALLGGVGLAAMFTGGGPPLVVYHISSPALGFARRGTEGPPRFWFGGIGETAMLEAVGRAVMFIGGGPPWFVGHISSSALVEGLVRRGTGGPPRF